MELAAGTIRSATTSASREAVLALLTRARNSYALRSANQAYDLKVSFTVDSAGQTNYDGQWQMEDLYVPGKGHRWTATTSAGYTITGISANGKLYSEGTASAIPLRLQDARGVLFDPLPSPAYASRGAIRTSTATFHGSSVTCLFLSRSDSSTASAPGRGWEENEECIDPQSGLLQMHSEAPGRYAVYDYSSAPQFAAHMLPRSVTVYEGGRVVMKVSVDSLQPVTSPDAAQVTPSESMKTGGAATSMTAATKVTRIHAQGPLTQAMTLRPIYVFGMVTSTGQLVEAHSLQPSDPNSDAAIADARGIDFTPSIPAGASPRQHFVFVLEKFAAQQ